MSESELIIIGALGIIFLLVLLNGRNRSNSSDAIYTSDPNLEKRVRELEQKVSYLYQQLDLKTAGVPSEMPSEIEELARAGRKIDAIKKYREYYNVGLKEAKDAVEAMQTKLR